MRTGTIVRIFRYGVKPYIFIRDEEDREDSFAYLHEVADAPQVHSRIIVEYERARDAHGWRARGVKAIGARYAAGGRPVKAKVRSWNEERGFGFAVGGGFGRNLFLHATELLEREEPPAKGDVIETLLVQDDTGLTCVNARVVARAKAKPRPEPEVTLADFERGLPGERGDDGGD